jgi:hypothetical protein
MNTQETTERNAPRCFRIIRFRFRGTKRYPAAAISYCDSRTIRSNVTEAEAQAHCSRDDTRGPGWFDGYDYMKGCAPKR